MIRRSWQRFFFFGKELRGLLRAKIFYLHPRFFSKPIISLSFKASSKTSLSFLVITDEVFADTKKVCQVVLILMVVGTSKNYSKQWRDINLTTAKDSLESYMILLWYLNSASLS